jgi:hypothetical protein
VAWYADIDSEESMLPSSPTLYSHINAYAGLSATNPFRGMLLSIIFNGSSSIQKKL